MRALRTDNFRCLLDKKAVCTPETRGPHPLDLAGQHVPRADGGRPAGQPKEVCLCAAPTPHKGRELRPPMLDRQPRGPADLRSSACRSDRRADLLMDPCWASAHTAAWTGSFGWVALHACMGWASGPRMNTSHKQQRIGIGRGAARNRKGLPPVGLHSSKYLFIARPEAIGEAPSTSNRAPRVEHLQSANRIA